MIRLIALDMDGTLLNPKSELTERTANALRRAMDAGAMVSLSSGRMTESMLPYAEKLQLNAPMILFNGGMIYDHRTDQVLFANVLPEDTAKRVARMVEDMGIYLQIYPGRGYYCSKRCAYTDAYEKQIGVNATELGVPVSGWMQGDMCKMLAIGEPADIDKAQIELKKAFPGTVNFMKSKANFLEIVAEGIDKGRSLAALGEILGVRQEEIMAFGDGQNDATMVAYAGCGVAMENGVDECKAGAQVIAPSNAEDGVAQVIERFLDEGRMGRG